MSYIERESLLIGVDSLISMMHVQAKGEPIQESAIKLVETTRDYIASFPTADVAEVRNGRWIVTDVVTCSECRHFTKSEFAGRWNYCPNCGALMRGNQHDG